jgi:hypothetical protein
MALHETIPEKHTAEFTLTSSSIQVIISACTLALAIIGLVGIYPMYMLTIATIAIGAWLLLEGGAITSRFAAYFREAPYSTQVGEFGVGLTSEFLGGVAGIVLGLLALLGIYPLILVPVAAMVYGASLIFGSGVLIRLDELFAEEVPEKEPTTSPRRLTNQAVVAAADIQALIGLGAMTLGILAIVGMYPLMLSLIAMIALSSAGLLAGAAISGRMLTLLRHRHQLAT